MRKFFYAGALCLAFAACSAPNTETRDLSEEKAQDTLKGAESSETGKIAPPKFDLEEANREEAAWARQEAVSMEGINANMTYSAFGNEPFWDLEFKGLTATYVTPEDLEGITFKVTRKTDGDWLRYSGKLDGEPFTLSMTLAPCENDMSGDMFNWTARLQKDGRTYNGCGKRY